MLVLSTRVTTKLHESEFYMKVEISLKIFAIQTWVLPLTHIVRVRLGFNTLNLFCNEGSYDRKHYLRF